MRRFLVTSIFVALILCGVVYGGFSVFSRGRQLSEVAPTSLPQESVPGRTATPAATLVRQDQSSVTAEITAVPSETPKRSPTASATPLAAIVEADLLNVRTGPSTSFPVIATAKRGESLTIIRTENGGAWLLVETGAGITGCVSAEFVVMSERQSTPAAREPAQTLASVPVYEILEIQDVSSASATRLRIGIRITKAATEAQLRLICEEVIAAQKRMTPHNAIAFFFYLSGTDPHGAYTGGSAIWAPNGRWEDADLVKTGDYSQHRLQVTVGSVFKSTPTPYDTDIPESVRKQIYYDLVVAQDSGIGTDESYTYIARKYGISENAVEKIAVEGTLRSWPMPPVR